MNEKAFAENLARTAGEMIRENFGSDYVTKGDGTPLTETDTAINRLVIDEIKKHFPGDGVLGEEESFSSEGSRVWVCDPIDGTTPFVMSMPTSTFSLALCSEGVPVLGVIYDVHLDRMFVAEQGKGATLNGKKIHVNDHSSIEGSIFNVEVGLRDVESVVDSLPLVEKLRDSGSFPLTFASVSYSMALVAFGKMMGAVFPLGNPWDGAAGKVIVEEAGGKVTDLFGNDQRYDTTTRGFVATNGKIHDTILEHIQEIQK